MGLFGDTAKAALDKAYKAIVEVQAIVGHIQKAAEAFKRRIADRLVAHDRRTDDRFVLGDLPGVPSTGPGFLPSAAVIGQTCGNTFIVNLVALGIVVRTGT